MSNPVKLFIVEGESRDYRFVNEMTRCFFKGRYTSTIINLPASQNLYMLYQKLEEDNFETDVVEVLKEIVDDAQTKLANVKRQDIDEVYLFFDYDAHQDNIGATMPNGPEIMIKMLNAFDNETENGKLYISYPMVEALYDYNEGECSAFSECYISLDSVGHYKELSGKNNPNASRRITIEYWRQILNVFYLRLQCLFSKENIDFQWYRDAVSPRSIYCVERQIGEQQGDVFVLSAFPEFLFDYFKLDFWKTMTPIKKKRFYSCPKAEL